MDAMHHFWRQGRIEYQHINQLDGYGSLKRFVINESTVLGVNEENQLWAYSTTEHTLDVMTTLPDNTDYLTDVDDSRALITIVQSSRKAVAELLLE